MDKPRWGVSVESVKEIKAVSDDEDNEDGKPDNEIYYDEDFSSEEEIPENVDDLLEFFVELGEKIDDDYFSDFVRAYADDDDLPDGGWEDTIFVKRGNRTFELDIEFHTEWCGDWSVRANLANGFTVLAVRETTKVEQ